MLYKLYKSRHIAGKKLADSEMERIFKGFQEIYKKYGVKVIGAWENVDDSMEYYFITAYRDSAHQKEAVAKMQANPEYEELSKKLQETRASIDVVTMRRLPGSP